MARFCTECGKELPDGVAFCTECGAKVYVKPKAKKSETVTEAAPKDEEVHTDREQTVLSQQSEPPTQQTQTPPQQTKPDTYTSPQQTNPDSPQQNYVPPQQNYVPPQQTGYVPPAADPANKVVGTGAFFGLILLFAIPIVGFIACVVMSFAPKNKNIKHFARAMLIWTIIAIVLIAILAAIITVITRSFINYIKQAIEEQIGDSEGIIGQIGDLEGIFGQTGDSEGILDQFGDLQDLLNQLQNGEFESLPTDYN